MSSFCAVPGRMTPGMFWPGNTGPVVSFVFPPPSAAVYIPPGGFAVDNRPEAPRQYPAGRELATEANANLATEAIRLLPEVVHH